MSRRGALNKCPLHQGKAEAALMLGFRVTFTMTFYRCVVDAKCLFLDRLMCSNRLKPKVIYRKAK